MSYNPNGQRNNLGTTGATAGMGMPSSATSGLGTIGGTSRTIPTTTSESTESAAESLRGKAEQLASTVKEKATELGCQVSERANAAVTSVGETMSSMAHSLRDHLPSSVPTYADRAADTLDRAGQYLQQQDLGDFVDDLSGMIRRNPIPSVLTGVALGFLLARSSRR